MGAEVFERIKRQVPNALSSARIGIAFVFPEVGWSARLVLFIIAMASEFLDGFLARRWKAVTLVGQLLDPVADKLFAISVGYTFVIASDLSIGKLALLLTRDIVVVLTTVIVMIAGHYEWVKEMIPNRLGKWATAFQYVFFFSLFAGVSSVSVFYVLAAVSSVAAAVKYAMDFWTIHRLREVF